MTECRKLSLAGRALLALGLPLFFAAGCNGKSGSGAAVKGSTGPIVWARGADSSGLDPAAETDGESLNVAANIFDGLVRFKVGTTEVEPALAKSWEISADGKTYTFHLRDGVKFHDGTPVNADAVVFSLERQRDVNHPAHALATQYGYWGSMDMNNIVAKVDKTDDATVVIHLQHAEAPLLADLAMQFAEIVSPTAVMKWGREFGRHPVGSGPYKFAEWQPGQRIVLQANEEYWDGAPKLKTVIWTVIKEASQRTQSFLAGQIDGFEGINAVEVEQLKAAPGATVLTQPGMNVCYLAINMDKKPFDNLKVRQAIAYAIDRDKIVANFYQGMGQSAASMIPPSMWGFNEALKPYPHDPAKAKALLAEAGFPNGFDTEFWYMTAPRPYIFAPSEVAAQIRQDFEAVGIRAKMVTFDWTTYLQKTQKGEHTMNLIGWSGDNGDPDNFLNTLLSTAAADSKPAQNYSFFRDPETDGYLAAAKTNPDLAARTALYKKAQQRIYDMVPTVPLAHSLQVVVVNSRLAQLKLSPDTRKRWELMPAAN